MHEWELMLNFRSDFIIIHWDAYLLIFSKFSVVKLFYSKDYARIENNFNNKNKIN